MTINHSNRMAVAIRENYSLPDGLL